MTRVKKIMLTNVPTLKKEANIEEGAKLLAQQSAGCVVITEGSKPIGILTELDFVRNIIAKGQGLKAPVSRIMNSPVVCMTPDMKLDEALKTIDTKKFRRYPVVDNGQLVGMVTKKDVVTAISDNVKFHRNIQNTVLVLFVLFEFFVFVVYRYVYMYLPFGA